AARPGGRRGSLGLAVLEFLVPSHLDGFEFGFVGGRGIAGEARELRDPFVHVREARSEEHTSELQSRVDLVCRLLLEKKKKQVHNDKPDNALQPLYQKTATDRNTIQCEIH